MVSDKTRFSKICIYLYMAESFSYLTETVFFGLPIADLLL